MNIQEIKEKYLGDAIRTAQEKFDRARSIYSSGKTMTPSSRTRLLSVAGVNAQISAYSKNPVKWTREIKQEIEVLKNKKENAKSESEKRMIETEIKSKELLIKRIKEDAKIIKERK